MVAPFTREWKSGHCYAVSVGGFRFTCIRGCTACCDQRGFVYLTEADLKRAAAFLGMTARAFERLYVYRTRHLLRLRKPRASQCPFLTANGCSIHPAKPTQCRTFPFWPELVGDAAAWKETAQYCPGIGQGRLISIENVLRRANEMRESYPEMYEPRTAVQTRTYSRPIRRASSSSSRQRSYSARTTSSP
ncbi:MAG TPA: YkgJ family cysteine cluster protein [Bryobacteraceae bacterium]|nr:YkgJ family cysteine cluster protein [Bryobacteraceae bacterium]HPU72511.1 YkgJ family cysteine cluster protein [Bryobacteraceae bacterium]